MNRETDMSRTLRTLALAAGASALLAGAAAPEADAQWRRNRGAVAAGVAAGVIGGVALGALAARQGSYGYHGGGYGYYGAPVYGEPVYGYAPGYEEETVVVERPAYGYGHGYRSPRRLATRAEGRNTMYDTIDRGW
jgi:hypothetical protein